MQLNRFDRCIIKMTIDKSEQTVIDTTHEDVN